MQAIAAENNLAETAFTVPVDRDDADFDLRWFTPTLEIGMCGHATLAAAHILLRGQQVRFSTKSGILTVTRNGELLELDMPAARVERAELPEVLQALGIAGASGADLPAARGSA